MKRVQILKYPKINRRVKIIKTYKYYNIQKLSNFIIKSKINSKIINMCFII